MNTPNKQDEKSIFWILGLIAIGIVIGVILSWIFIFISIDSIINNVLPHIQISNINFNLNETALVNAINNTFIK